jgi:hypothetical protein
VTCLSEGHCTELPGGERPDQQAGFLAGAYRNPGVSMRQDCSGQIMDALLIKARWLVTSLASRTDGSSASRATLKINPTEEVSAAADRF